MRESDLAYEVDGFYAVKRGDVFAIFAPAPSRTHAVRVGQTLTIEKARRFIDAATRYPKQFDEYLRRCGA